MTARGAGVLVTYGGAIAESRTHLSSRNPHPGRSGGDSCAILPMQSQL
jgi:hypothetical protein